MLTDEALNNTYNTSYGVDHWDLGSQLFDEIHSRLNYQKVVHFHDLANANLVSLENM